MKRWLEQLRAWQVFAIAWAATALAGLAGVISSTRPDHRHLDIGTLRGIVLFSLFMAASVTVGVQLGKAQKRRGSNPDT